MIRLNSTIHLNSTIRLNATVRLKGFLTLLTVTHSHACALPFIIRHTEITSSPTALD